MTAAEESAFVIALVLFAVGTFLAPVSCSSPSEFDRGAVVAVADPSRIQSFDWAGFTLASLFLASNKARTQLQLNGRDCMNIDGCAVFLIVMIPMLFLVFQIIHKLFLHNYLNFNDIL